MRRLEDLDFADDLALLSNRLQDMQDKVDALRKVSQRVGLRISKEKTKVLRTNNRQETPITIGGLSIEDVQEFTYLGRKISQTGGTEEDISARIKKARQTFAILRPVWKATAISACTKLCIFSSNVKSILMYGSETWRVTKSSSNKIQTFINKCLRQILNIKWFDRVPNIDLWTRTNQEQISVQIKRRKWRWIGHTLRK